MLYPDNYGGRCTSRGLCEDIKLLTEQRLAFDKKMSDRARGSAATRPLSPTICTANTHKEARLPHKTGTILEDHNSTQQTAALGMSTEGRVTYLKLRGDQLLHQAEMARYGGGVSIPECEGLAAEALEAYLTAQKEASSNVNSPSTITTNTVNIRNSTSRGSGRVGSRSSSNSSGSGNNGSGALPEVHPLQVELALRISSVLLHLLGRPVEAWEAGYSVYLAVSERPARLGARSLAIAQILRDHLACIDIQGDGVPGHHDLGSRKSEKNYNYHNDDSVSTTDCQTTTRGLAEGGQGQGLDRGEWGFLRMSAGSEEYIELPAGIGRIPSDNLRVLAQVKQARACMDVASAKKGMVLLGTMAHADIVQSALKKAREGGRGGNEQA